MEYDNDEVPKKVVSKTKKRSSEETAKSEPGATGNQEFKEEKIQKWEPRNWEKMLENIRVMRKEAPAPVDTMGCDIFRESNADPKVSRYHCLLSLMLSSQTKDEVSTVFLS